MASSFKSLEDLDLTRDEVERIGNALKKDEFRKLLVEYVEEIQDPENRKIYEQEITQLEKERGVNVTFINPVAGYVIKTSVNGNKKGFINICANEHIQKPTSSPGVHDGNRGLQWTLPHTLTPPKEDIDNKGLRCLVYDVCFHPDTLHLASKNKAFRTMVNNTACDAVEKNFDVKLDKKNLKFPKLQYKGFPTASVIRKSSGEKPLERDPETQKLYDQIYAQADEKMNKPTKKSSKKSKSPRKNVDLDPVYTAPKYLIKHRSHIEMEEFTEDKNAKMNSTIPKELVIEINLPLLKSANEIVLDVTEKTVQLISEKPAKYKLFLTLPYQVNQDTGNAKFDKDTKKLIVTLPVKRTSHFVCDDSGVESDHNSPQPDSPISEICEEDLVVKPTISSDRTTAANDFLDENEEYLLPEFSCHLFDNIIAFTLHVKNVDESSVKKIIDETKSSIHVKFTSISSGFYPTHYAFYVLLKETSLIDADDVTVEVWDNNVILQFAIKSCDKSINSYLVGVDENNTTEKFIEEPSVINHVMKEEALNAVTEENKTDETPTEESEPNAVNESTSDDRTEEVLFQNNEKYTSKAIDIIGNYSESSGDELSYSYSPSRNKGILKRLTSRSVSRSVSESSIDDYIVASSFENCHTSVDSIIPEDGEVSTSLKKTVRFNNVVSRQLYRLDSSILGQKKKNQRKARNKKRALERRHSESEASEVEDKKEGEKKTSCISLDKILNSNAVNEERKEQQDIFHFDMN